MEYQIKGEWRQVETGRMYIAKAVASTGRILAIVRVEIPLDVGFDFATYFGKRLSEQEIVEAAHAQAETLAKATN